MLEHFDLRALLVIYMMADFMRFSRGFFDSLRIVFAFHLAINRVVLLDVMKFSYMESFHKLAVVIACILRAEEPPVEV